MLDTYVRPEWIDYNGHMTDSRYLQVFGDAMDALFRWAGVDDAYRKAGRAHVHTWNRTSSMSPRRKRSSRCT